MTFLRDPDGTVREGNREDWLVRHIFLSFSPEETAKQWYVWDKIDVREYERLLDAVILGKGCEAAVRCPRCGALVHGIGSTSDRSLIAVRCDTPECNFVGYAEA